MTLNGVSAGSPTCSSFPFGDGSARIGHLEPPPSGFVAPQLIGRLGDGGLIALAAAPAPATLDVTRSDVALLRYDADGRFRNVVAQAAGSERVSLQQGPAVTTHLLPFGRNTLAAVGPDFVVVMDTHDPSVRYYDPEGQLLRVATWPQARRPLTAGDWERYADSVAATLPEPQRSARIQTMARLPRPETFPIARLLRVDAHAHVWVGLADGNRWLVLTPEGRALGAIELPPRFTPTDIGDDYVLGVWRDAMDVEYVRSYGLRREERRPVADQRPARTGSRSRTSVLPGPARTPPSGPTGCAARRSRRRGPAGS